MQGRMVLTQAEAIKDRLQGAVPLSRREAAAIVAHPEARALLLQALKTRETADQAALLLAEIGHPEDVPPLLTLLRECHEPQRLVIVLEALARLGRPAFEPLAALARHPSGPPGLSRLAAAEALSAMACLHEDTGQDVSALFLELIQAPDINPPELAQLALWLDMLDRREAFPVLERRLAECPDCPYSEARLNEWKCRPPGPLPGRLEMLQPFERFLPEHRAEYFRLLATMIDQASVLPDSLRDWPARFEQDLTATRQRLAPTQLPGKPAVGRNEPCPCGSGRKYKKCHLDSDLEAARPDPLAATLRNVAWPSVGHALLPSEQWERLSREELRAHLEILSLPPADVDRRAEQESSDYLLWSCAQSRILRGDWAGARELATLVAASQQGHPALNYDEIALVAQSTDSFLEGQQDLGFMLNSGNFVLAWEALRRAWTSNVEEGMRIYRQVQQARPGLLWSAAALAEAARACAPELALPELRQALRRARDGESQSPPGVPGRACSPWVLEAYVAELEQAVTRSRELQGLVRRMLERPADDLLSPGLTLSRSRYQAVDADLKRHLEQIPTDLPGEQIRARRQEVKRQAEERRLQLAFELGQHFQTVVASDAVVSASRPGEVLWILPQPAQPGLEAQTFAWHSFAPLGGDSALAHCANALGEVARSTRASRAELIPCSWRGFAAWLLRVETEEEELDEMARLIASDRLRCRFVDALWAPLERELQITTPPPGPEAAESVGEHQEHGDELGSYLARVLTRLLRSGKVGAAHTDKGHFTRGVPDRLRGELKDKLEELIARGFMREKPTVTGPHISLEPGHLGEIKSFVAGEGELLGLWAR